jgi:hypothetical protein
MAETAKASNDMLPSNNSSGQALLASPKDEEKHDTEVAATSQPPRVVLLGS